MIKKILKDSEKLMQKAIDAFHVSLNKIRTGRPHASLLDGIVVNYHNVETPLNQVAGITVDDNQSLVISPWEKSLLPEVEKAVLRSNLGLTPMSSKDVVRINLPPLTEETRRSYVRQAKDEAEQVRVSVRNSRREAKTHLKKLVKEGACGQDEEKGAELHLQKQTDLYIGEIDQILSAKESELMKV